MIDIKLSSRRLLVHHTCIVNKGKGSPYSTITKRRVPEQHDTYLRLPRQCDSRRHCKIFVVLRRVRNSRIIIIMMIPVLGSQPAGDVSHKPGGRLPLLSARPAVTLAALERAATNFAAW